MPWKKLNYTKRGLMIKLEGEERGKYFGGKVALKKPIGGCALMGSTLTTAVLLNNPLGINRNSVPKLPIKCLTLAKIQEKTEKSVCFNCDEKYHVNHCCKSRFLILIGNDEEWQLNLEMEDEKV